MKCSACGSENVFLQSVTEVKEVKRKRGCAYWLFIGWWLEIIMWVFLTLIRLIILCFSRRTKVVSETSTVAICQRCGYRWTVR